MKNVKISLIVPVYNDREYLYKSLPALINQKFTDFELILVDDGSTDGSSEILDNYARHNSVVRIVHKENGGASSARNAGLRVADGEWIVFADSDDIVSPNYLKDLYDGVGDCDMAWYGETKVYPNGVEVASSCSSSQIIDMHIPANVSLMLNMAWHTNFPGPCCKIFRKDIFFQNDIFMEEDMVFGEDFHCLLRVLEKCDLVKIIAGCAQNYLYYQNLDSVTYCTGSFEQELTSFIKLSCEVERFIEQNKIVGKVQLFNATLHNGKQRVIQSLYFPGNNYSKRERIVKIKSLKRDQNYARHFFHSETKQNKVAVIASSLGLWNIVDKLAQKGLLS